MAAEAVTGFHPQIEPATQAQQMAVLMGHAVEQRLVEGLPLSRVNTSNNRFHEIPGRVLGYMPDGTYAQELITIDTNALDYRVLSGDEAQNAFDIANQEGYQVRYIAPNTSLLTCPH